MLIASLQIEVGRGAQIGAGLQDAGVTDPGIKPDIQDVRFFSKVAPLTMGTNGAGRQILPPEEENQISAPWADTNPPDVG